MSRRRERTRTLLHTMELVSNGLGDPESLELIDDLWAVTCSLHQSMPVVGPWLEQRIAWLVRRWLPEWEVSGGQVFDWDEPELRSRSWDLIVHRPLAEELGLPPPATPGGGSPLVPRELCCAVVDTKTFFADVAAYARQPVFNLMRDATRLQLDFLGDSISKNVLACMTSLSPPLLESRGKEHGLNVFVLGRYQAGPIGPKRRTRWELWPGEPGAAPLQRFRSELERAARDWQKRGAA
jgi:hypothetical protein